jgi:hypothetical protein
VQKKALKTSYSYCEEVADEIFNNLGGYLPFMEKP